MVELPNPTEELNRAVERVLASTSDKRLIVAGPGAGKTFLFRKILEHSDGDEHSRIALTFINELKDDLEKCSKCGSGIKLPLVKEKPETLFPPFHYQCFGCHETLWNGENVISIVAISEKLILTMVFA